MAANLTKEEYRKELLLERIRESANNAGHCSSSSPVVIARPNSKKKMASQLPTNTDLIESVRGSVNQVNTHSDRDRNLPSPRVVSRQPINMRALVNRVINQQPVPVTSAPFWGPSTPYVPPRYTSFPFLQYQNIYQRQRFLVFFPTTAFLYPVPAIGSYVMFYGERQLLTTVSTVQQVTQQTQVVITSSNMEFNMNQNILFPSYQTAMPRRRAVLNGQGQGVSSNNNLNAATVSYRPPEQTAVTTLGSTCRKKAFISIQPVKQSNNTLDQNNYNSTMEGTMLPVRAERFAAKKPGKFCNFCKSNKEIKSFYTSHNIRDTNGIIQCPILRRFVCPTCKATGDNAHTISYCPQGDHSNRHGASRCRNAAGGYYLSKF